MNERISEKEVREQLKHIEKFLDQFRFEEAWNLANPLLDKTEFLDEKLAIDVINGAGKARKWFKGDNIAKELLEKGLERAREANYRHGEAFALNYLGSLLRDNFKPQDALEYYEKALIIWRELESTLWLGNVHSNMSGCFENLGSLSKALDYIKQALKFHRQSSNKRAIFRSESQLASLYYQIGDFQRTVKHSREAVATANELGNRIASIDARLLEGIVLKRSGKLKEAKKFFQNCLRELDEIKITQSAKKYQYRSLNYNLANTHELLGEYNDARELYLQLLEEEKQHPKIAWLQASSGLGKLALGLGNLEEAATNLEEAVIKYRAKPIRGTHFVEDIVILSSVYIDLGKLEKAKELLKEAHSVQLDTKYTEVLMSYGEGLLAQAERNLQAARKSFQRCQTVADEIGLIEYQIRALFHLATLNLFEYRISNSHESLAQMKYILGQAHSISKTAHMPVLALEIGILKGLSYSEDLDFNGSIAVLEDSMIQAEELGLEGKISEIQSLLDQIRERRKRAAESANPEISWDSNKISEYLSSVQNLVRTYREGP